MTEAPCVTVARAAQEGCPVTDLCAESQQPPQYRPQLRELSLGRGGLAFASPTPYLLLKDHFPKGISCHFGD